MAGSRLPFLEWAVASSAFSGETDCGDRHVVTHVEAGALIAVLDGLGHGPDAARAAVAAAEILRSAPDQSLIALIERCHEGVRKTRGVAMTLARIDSRSHSLSWIGVGNVEGHLLRESPDGAAVRESVLLRPGVVGFKLPPLRTSSHALASGDLLLLATDGIAPGFAENVMRSASPQRIAERILQSQRRNDDALVLVARYTQSQP